MSSLMSSVPRKYRRPEIVTAAVVLLFLSTMEFGVKYGYINPLVLQQPTVVFDQMVSSLTTNEIQSDIVTTAWRVFITFVISAAIGSVLSLVLWQNETLRRAYLPLFGAIFATPIPLMYLVFVVLFGRGTAAIVAISVPLGVIPFVINATDALATVDPARVKVARSFNATSWQLIWKVFIPDAAPDIFTGVRIGFSYIVISVTAIEFLLVTQRGLGGYISDAYFKFKTSEMFVGIGLVIILVIIAIFLLKRTEESIRR